MGMLESVKNFFLVDEEDDEMEYNEKPMRQVRPEPVQPVQPAQSRFAQKKVVKFQSPQPVQQKQSQVMIIEPRDYGDAQIIADHLLSQRNVILNLQQIKGEQARRIIDFLSGSVYAIQGDIRRIGANIFICTPDSTEVTGDITHFKNELQDNVRWD